FSFHRWAWQHPHMSKKIPDELRLTTKSKRPSISLAGRLASLHLLLRAPAFARWPLTLRFFSEEVHRNWTAHCAKTTALPTGLKVVFDPRIADSEDEESVSADENEPPP